MSFFPIIDLKGQPFDIGLAHGRALAGPIATNYKTYLNMISGNAGLDEDRVIQLARLFVPFLEDAAPHLLEEMEGIAKGAGIALDSVLVLNARTELAFPDQLAGGECTSIGLSGQRTTQGQTILAQNWDWLPVVKTRSALFRVQPAKGPRALIMCEAGQVSKFGFNESGVGHLLNILIYPGVRTGVPVHVLSRLVLESADAVEAEAKLLKARRASSSHFLVGDLTGRLRGVETAPQAAAVIEPTGGALVHTNHFRDPVLAEKDLIADIAPDSFDRLRRISEIIEGQEKWDADQLKAALADHSGQPDSICRHVSPHHPEHLQMETLGSFIFDLGQKTAQVAYGQPCQNSYQKVTL